MTHEKAFKETLLCKFVSGYFNPYCAALDDNIFAVLLQKASKLRTLLFSYQ